MTVDANLIVAERDNALLIPATALQSDAAWVVNDGRLHRQPVRVGVTRFRPRRDPRSARARRTRRRLARIWICARGARAHIRAAKATASEVMLALDDRLAHLTTRKRQTLVSLSGVVLGVAFFLAVSSLMRGSEKDFVRRLVDNSPAHHRLRRIPAAARPAGGAALGDGAVQISNVKPQTETRGIRGHRQKIEFVESLPGVRVAPVLVGSAVLTFAGRQEGVSLSRCRAGDDQERVDDRREDHRRLARHARRQSERHRDRQGLADKFNLGVGSTLGSPRRTARAAR